MSSDISILWQQGVASVQLLLTGQYRAINAQSRPKVFDKYAEAEAYAKAKIRAVA